MSEKKIDLDVLMAEMKKLDDMPANLQVAMDMLLVEKRLIQEKADAEKQPIDTKLEQLNESHRRLTGEYYDKARPEDAAPIAPKGRGAKGKATGTVKPKAKGAKGKRIRRDPAALVAHAQAILKIVKKAGKNGASIGEISKGAPGKITGSLKDYVKTHTGAILGDNGAARNQLRYTIK